MLNVTPISAVACGPTHVPASHPDAELLALGRTFDAAFAAYLPVRPSELAAGEGRQAAWDAQPDLTPEAIAGDPEVRKRWRALCAPFESSIVLARDLRDQADDPAEAAFRLPPPQTLPGLAVLARMLAGFHVGLWDGPPEALEIDGRMLRATLEATLAIAGVDRLGRPVADAPMPRACDPILAAISDCRAALLEHIAACESPDAETLDGDARRSVAGDAAFAAWKALMATPPTTVAGVQALAGFVPWYVERGGAYDDLRDHNTLFRQIAGADLREGAGSAGAASISSAKPSVLSAVGDDLERLDRELRLLCISAGTRDIETMPGYCEREAERDIVLKTLIECPAVDAADLRTKARTLRSRGLIGDHERHGDLAISLADDIERLCTLIPVGLRTPELLTPIPMAAE